MCNFYFMFYTDYTNIADLDLICSDDTFPSLTKHMPPGSKDPPPPNPDLEAEAHGHHHHVMGGNEDQEESTEDKEKESNSASAPANGNGARFPGRNIVWSRFDDRYAPASASDYFNDYSSPFEADQYYNSPPRFDPPSYNYYQVQNQRSRNRRPLEPIPPPSQRGRYPPPAPQQGAGRGSFNRQSGLSESDVTSRVRLNEPQRITVAAGRSAMSRKPSLASASDALMSADSRRLSKVVETWGKHFAMQFCLVGVDVVVVVGVASTSVCCGATVSVLQPSHRCSVLRPPDSLKY